VLTLMLIVSAYRLNLTWEVTVGKVLSVSERTRDVLADTQGAIKISCFMDRRHPMFRPVSRLLRGLQLASRSVAGAEIVVEYVDPRWDLVRAARLAAAGVPENALLFERQRRRIVVTLDDMLMKSSAMRVSEEGREAGSHAGLGVFRGEMVCASSISRLSRPHERSVIYWSQGHGEVRFDDYDTLRGFSDIAREIKRDGFDLQQLNLVGIEQIPDDCQVLVMAGARYAVAVKDVQLLETFLQRGGRLFYMAAPRAQSGMDDLLARWGIRLTSYIAVSSRTLTGNELVATEFADHVITRNLKNASVVFGHAICIEIAEGAAAGADSPKVDMLVQTDGQGWGEAAPDILPRVFDPHTDSAGPVTVAAVAERGGNVSSDVHFRPTRICVVGEADFVMNGTLATRANANRDLFMNALHWLAGIEAGTAASLGGDATLVTGFERHEWVQFMILASAVLPAVVLSIFCLAALRRRK
ncbi:MAG: Gldg family protein, partial [Kiritimatiellae bacterium]|nr:Gldg family protein [Kiritimatiellia bacterium]